LIAEGFGTKVAEIDLSSLAAPTENNSSLLIVLILCVNILTAGGLETDRFF